MSRCSHYGPFVKGEVCIVCQKERIAALEGELNQAMDAIRLLEAELAKAYCRARSGTEACEEE